MASRIPPLLLWLPGAWSIGWALVPGFAVLDYHACLVNAPVVGIVAGLRVIAGLQAGASISRIGREIGLIAAQPLVVCLVASLGPAPVCDWTTGLQFFALGPLMSALVGALMGATAHAGSENRPRSLLMALATLAAAPPLLFFATQPQAFGFHPLVGWIAGPLYEDAVAPGWAYIAARLMDIAIWGAAALLGRHRGAPLLLIAALLVFTLRAGPEGWLVSTARVQAELSEVRRLPGVTLHIHRGALLTDLWAADFAFQAQQLRAFFGADPSAPIDAFIYRDAEQKRRLMGAERVELAKPWLRQVHIVAPSPGSSIVRHELAHVFAADHAPWPFRVPMRAGLIPDALLIEGLAVAAEWPVREGMTVHQWARAMRRLKLAPRVDELLDPAGFFSHAGANAYTIAGSYLRFVRDKRGVAEALRLYQEGTTGPYVAAWQAFVDSDAAGPLTEAQLAMARARFERPAIFRRKCALHAGRTYRQIALAAALNDHRRRLVIATSLHEALADVGSGWTVCRALIAAALPARCPPILETLKTRGLLNTTTRQATSALILGDAATGQRQQEHWLQALALSPFLGTRRAAAVRVLSPVAAGLLSAERLAPWTALTLRKARESGDPAVHYLAMRAWFWHPERPAALGPLEVAARLPADDPKWAIVRRETERLAVVDAAWRGDCGEGPHWTDALQARCRFMRTRRSGPTPAPAPFQSAHPGPSPPSGT